MKITKPSLYQCHSLHREIRMTWQDDDQNGDFDDVGIIIHNAESIEDAKQKAWNFIQAIQSGAVSGCN